MSTIIRCPSCSKPTEVPSYEGDGAYFTCGCPQGKALAKGHPAPRR